MDNSVTGQQQTSWWSQSQKSLQMLNTNSCNFTVSLYYSMNVVDRWKYTDIFSWFIYHNANPNKHLYVIYWWVASILQCFHQPKSHINWIYWMIYSSVCLIKNKLQLLLCLHLFDLGRSRKTHFDWWNCWRVESLDKAALSPGCQ